MGNDIVILRTMICLPLIVICFSFPLLFHSPSCSIITFNAVCFCWSWLYYIYTLFFAQGQHQQLHQQQWDYTFCYYSFFFFVKKTSKVRSEWRDFLRKIFFVCTYDYFFKKWFKCDKYTHWRVLSKNEITKFVPLGVRLYIFFAH